MVPDVLSAKPSDGELYWSDVQLPQKTDCRGKERVEGNLPNRRNSSDILEFNK